MSPIISGLKRRKTFPGLWVLPRISRLFEGVYPQKYPHFFSRPTIFKKGG